MQDIHSLVGGRIFGATTSGDRRLRPLQHHHHHSSHHHHQQQALKCPRCDSLNTKFCYYNNYNLSQPRHFCKSCRRYWTKGGVLRNVPVGGGCRKNKRSKPKNNNPSTTPALSVGEQPQTAPPPPAPPAAEKPPHPAEPKSSPPSSSESSSVTGTEAAAAAAVVSAPAPASAAVSASEILGMSEFRSVVPASADPNTCGPVFEHALLEQLGTAGDNSVMFSESNGNGNGGGSGFTGLMMTSWNEPFSASSNAILLNNQQSQWFHEDKLQGIAGGFLDQTVENRSGEGNSGFGALDWQPSGGDNVQALFDLPNTVDQAYWSHTQWTDQDNTNLYLP